MQLIDTMFRQPPTSLYIHIPFCASRCFYCDFTTHVAPSPVQGGYVDDLLLELSLRRADASLPLKTVFFGGGTPTLLDEQQWSKILAGLHEHYQLDRDVEITVEANPGTVSEEKLSVLRAGGVNRISFGAQTFNPALLMAIGRLHDVDAIEASVRMAKRAQFEHINVDLMFGLPDQTLDDVRDSIARVKELEIDHVSAYWLKVESGTPFGKWQEQGMLPLPGEDAEADMYDEIVHLMDNAGFVHYEVSNFALPGGEAKHNLVYWKNEPYLAAGVGAHGFLYGQRFENVKSLTTYHQELAAKRLPEAERFSISPEESCENTMMLGLRLREGVHRDRFRARHQASVDEVFGKLVQDLEGKGLVSWVADSLRLTDRAWPIGNVVFEQFVGALN